MSKKEWTNAEVKTETLEKVKARLPQDRSVKQRQVLDEIILKGLAVK